jgi:hypothetical protein
MASKKLYTSKLRIAYRLIRFTTPRNILVIEPRHVLTDATGEAYAISTDAVNLQCDSVGSFLEALDRLYNQAAVMPVLDFDSCLVHATNGTLEQMAEASGESDESAIERDRR